MGKGELEGEEGVWVRGRPAAQPPSTNEAWSSPNVCGEGKVREEVGPFWEGRQNVQMPGNIGIILAENIMLEVTVAKSLVGGGGKCVGVG